MNVRTSLLWVNPYKAGTCIHHTHKNQIGLLTVHIRKAGTCVCVHHLLSVGFDNMSEHVA